VTYVVDKNNEIIYASINPNSMERTEMKEYLENPVPRDRTIAMSPTISMFSKNNCGANHQS